MAKRKALSLSEKIKIIKNAGLEIKFGYNPTDLKDYDLKERAKMILEIIKKAEKKKPGEMIFFVMYDISDNKVRTEIAKYLLKQGCERIQKSVFIGSLDLKKYNQIYQDLKEVQGYYENEDSIILLPISELELKKMKLIGQNIDMDLTLGKGNSMFF